MGKQVWKINKLEYLETHGLSVLMFHNHYFHGKQGGVEIIQHGERIASNGNLILVPDMNPIVPLIHYSRFDRRVIDRENVTISVDNHFPEENIEYTISVRGSGPSFYITVDLKEPLARNYKGKVGFNLEFFPALYFGKTYSLGKECGIFSRDCHYSEHKPAPLARGQKLVIAPETPLCKLEIESATGELSLSDTRNIVYNGWFNLFSFIPCNGKKRVIEWIVTPHIVPGWERNPVICFSQAGYHPGQKKQAVIELDSRADTGAEAILECIDPEKGIHIVKTKNPETWGMFLRYKYVIFDFSEIKKPGLYRIRYKEVCTRPFKIDSCIFMNNLWQPALDTFLPVQMCHMEVRDKSRVWHGRCHLDDALQAPLNHKHMDGYQQGEKTDTGFEPFTHIPGLNRGGWHDAGDYDLATGSQAVTTLVLSLIQEQFHIDMDRTTIQPDKGLVLLYVPDGIPDIIQQITHGVEIILSGFRQLGHSFIGIIEGEYQQYIHLGDASTITDNLIYDPLLKEDEVRQNKSGKKDDRWVFTNRNTNLEYTVVSALAAAGRVLKEYNRTHAEECITAAVKIWEYEQTHAPVYQENEYVPKDREMQEVLAACELFLLTNKESYGNRIKELMPGIKKNISEVGWSVTRILPFLHDTDFENELYNAFQVYKAELDEKLAGNPFGIPYNEDHLWGIGWNIQWYALRQFFLVKTYPGLFDRENLLTSLNYVLGCHPGSNMSFISGAGANSPYIAYGGNRADWSYIPGGVMSGTNHIKPDFPELKENFPFIWQQSEYVISGAATFIFCVLAADHLLNGTL
ncbi:MAG: glycoside hydrolase family 9 protein [Spirochaetales bacterium]|nr:glycoside hydrolase family 9 protein [Spirochaetales bacterium]